MTDNGASRIQGRSLRELADEYGTPLYVYDSEAFARQYHGLREELHPRVEMFFSLKSNPNLSVCSLLGSFGARAEVSSLVELRTALKAGIGPEDIIFLGPGKSRAELEACLDEGIYAIVCESFGELEVLDGLAAARGLAAPVALRVNPAFAVKGARLTMGGKPRQFGIDEQILYDTPDLAARFPSVRLMGVHAYMGTRILSEGVIEENTAKILEMAERIAERLDFPLELVDIGGGLGVAYFSGETDLDVTVLTERINPVLDKFAATHPDTRMIMELGRYLTAPAGDYVVRVRYVKESMGENFAVTDGGTHHHMAAVGIGSFVKRNFPVRLVDAAPDAETEPWNVTGPLCTPNDTLVTKAPLPELRPGDLLAIGRSGAYGPTASPGLFLSHGYPAEVLVHEGRALLVRERDTTDDLFSKQRLHEFPRR
ncbi:MAG TPA: type III PLP-dependent enzyme [Thermobifida alba]|uniref:Diaminopimelate decarboxylase n=1 Tax=Thermobifida cellulosilytica TB100 TaxID=665004 RepID=A0A147KH41_THECS|nr:type III PLP-dependent enzyme [Thermobifida cellulosilytica]KUP96591.1 diaminopimelate decarboxylase [Thermobifida cellulosilytica TB100]HLU97383.1 type III PLP-dependent enzyme [Thermobifida alba]